MSEKGRPILENNGCKSVAGVDNLEIGCPFYIVMKYRYSIRPTIMTRAESAFFERLTTIIGDDYFLFPQVHLSALFDHRIKKQWWRAAFGHINGKSVDFVVCDKQLKPILAIELDDWSHGLENRKLRDSEVERIFHESSLRLLRINDPQTIPDEKLKELLSNSQLLGNSLLFELKNHTQ